MRMAGAGRHEDEADEQCDETKRMSFHGAGACHAQRSSSLHVLAHTYIRYDIGLEAGRALAAASARKEIPGVFRVERTAVPRSI